MRPDGDHADEQSDRCQGRRFFNNCTKHDYLPKERRGNIVHLLFFRQADSERVQDIEITMKSKTAYLDDKNFYAAADRSRERLKRA